MKRTRSARGALALALLLMAGCAVDQSKEVAFYRQVLDEGSRQPVVAALSPGKPLGLKDVLAIANAHNEGLAMAGEDFLQALIAKDRAFARFMPTIGFAPAFMREEKSTYADLNALMAKLVPEEYLDLPFQVGMQVNPVLDGAMVMTAQSTAESRRAALLDRQSVLFLDVAQTFFLVMTAEKRVSVLENSVRAQEQRVADMKVRREAGVERILDVAREEARLARIRRDLIQAKTDAANGRSMLALLIGVPKLESPLESGFEPPAQEPAEERLLALAAARRQDLQMAHANITAAAHALQAAWGEYYPSVSLNLGSYISRESFPDDVNWTSLIRVNVPIFTAGLVHSDVRAAYSRLRQANLAESYVSRKVRKEVFVALSDLSNDAGRLEQLLVETKAASEAVRQAQVAFEAGMGTNLEYLIAQDTLLGADLALTEARFKKSVDYLRLLAAVGALDAGLSPPDDPNGAGAAPASPPHAAKAVETLGG